MIELKYYSACKNDHGSWIYATWENDSMYLKMELLKMSPDEDEDDRYKWHFHHLQVNGESTYLNDEKGFINNFLGQSILDTVFIVLNGESKERTNKDSNEFFGV